MKKLFLPFILLVLIVIACYSAISIATERPPIDFSDRPLKLWVPYDPKKPDDLYNMPQNYVFIQAADLKEIEDAKNPTKTQVDNPPVNYQLSSAAYYANVKGDYITITGVYSIGKLDNEWTLIPIISDQVGLASASLDNKPAFMTTFNAGQDLSKFKNASEVSSGNYFLALKDKGIHQLKINFSVKKTKDPSINTESFLFNLPNIPVISLNCLVNQKNLEFHVTGATATSSKNVVEGTKLFASFPPITTIEVKWNPKSNIAATSSKVKSTLPPSISATTYNRIEVGRGSLKGALTVDIDIRYSALDHFDFYVPEDVEIDSISAANNIELVDPSPTVKNGILPIDLTSAIEGKLTLIINYRKNFNDPSFITKIPAITLANKNIEREVGYVGVIETTNIDSTIKEADQTKNFQEIDSAELTGPLSGLKTSIAFKYQKINEKALNFPYDITISVVRHQDVAVYEANISSINIVSVLNKAGQLFSKATFQVTNTRKQFLDIRLPKNSEIWSVYVDGKSVKPAIKDDKINLYSIPLAKSLASDQGSKTFPVEIVYYKFKPFWLPAWSLGFVNIKALAPELAANSINWTIYFPNESKFFPITLFSNLQKEKGEGPVPLNTFNLPFAGKMQMSNLRMNKVAPEPMEMRKDEKGQAYDEIKQTESESRTREELGYTEGGEKQIADNAPAAPPVPMQQAAPEISKQWGDFSSYSNQQGAQQLAFRSKKVGKLPVYVYLPQVGNAYYLYQNSFKANQSPYIFTFYLNNNVFGFVILAAFVTLLLLMAVPFREKQFKTIKFILPAILFIWLSFTMIGWNIIWIFILLGLYLLAKWIFTLPSKVKNTIVGIVAVILLFVILFFIAVILHIVDLCFALIVLLIAIIGIIALITVVIKTRKYWWPFKKKPKKEEIKPDADVASELNKEGQNNE